MSFSEYVKENRNHDNYLPPNVSPDVNSVLYTGTDEIYPYTVVPSHSVQTARLQEASTQYYTHHRSTPPASPFLSWLDDIIVTKPWDQLTKQERIEKLRRWHEQQRKSHVPEWARKIQRIVTALDNVEDILSSLAAITRLGAFLLPGIGPELMFLSGVFDLAALALDIPKDLLALPLGPVGLKRVVEDVSILTNPRKVLWKILKKEVPKTLKEALPSWGELLEMAQAALTVFGRGLCLGPIMGKISDLWFSALESVGIVSPPQPHTDYPRRTGQFTRPHTNYASASGKPLQQTLPGGYPSRIDTIRVPQGRHSPIRFLEIPVRVVGNFDYPTREEFIALKTWKWCYDVLSHPGGIDEETLYAALIAHASTMPWAIQYLQRTEAWKIAAAIAKHPVIPEMPWPADSAELIRSLGEDPYEATKDVDYTGNSNLTYAELAESSIGYVAYRAWEIRRRHTGSIEGVLANALINYLAFSYMHALDTDPPDHTEWRTSPLTGTTYPVIYKETAIKTLDPVPDIALKRLREWEIELPESTSNEEWKKYVDCYNTLVRVNNRYPNKKEWLKCVFSSFSVILYRGREYRDMKTFLKENPWYIRT